MNEKKYLKWYQKVAYGSGDMAGNCGYALISSFVMLYLTNAVGLNSAIIGTLMMVSKLFSTGSLDFFAHPQHTKATKNSNEIIFLYIKISFKILLSQ